MSTHTKFRRVFTGDAEQLRKTLIEHFKDAEERMARDRDIHGTDYAAGLAAGRQSGYRDAWQFMKTVEIAELVN